MNKFKAVKRWMKSFLVPMNKKFNNVSKDRYELRYELMKEENEEYLEACQTNNLVEILDALCDKRFILEGTIHEHGVSQELFDKCFKEVTDSNFSKMENGKPIFREDGKILKGKGYFKPNIKKILDDYKKENY